MPGNVPTVLPTKLPGEIRSYQFDFSNELDTGDTVTSATVTVLFGDIVMTGKTSDTTKVNFVLSGGTARQMARLLIAATTTRGFVLEEEALVLIDG